jgi:hypothetical protein
MAEWEYEDDAREFERELENTEVKLYKADDPAFWGDWYGYQNKRG